MNYQKRKIRYLFNNTSRDIYVVFLHGFKSDLEGDKPKILHKFCKKKNIGFLGLEYSGHGKSYGKFEDGTISSWTNDVKKVINKKIKPGISAFLDNPTGAGPSRKFFQYTTYI